MVAPLTLILKLLKNIHHSKLVLDMICLNIKPIFVLDSTKITDLKLDAVSI